MEVSLKNKTILITGASKGIGRSLVEKFADEECNIIINYNTSETEAKNLLGKLRNKKCNAMLIKCDITNVDEVIVMHRCILESYPKIDVLINNAGKCSDNRINLMSFEQWRDVVETNLTGTFLCCREISKSMIMNRSGKIINISSLKGQLGSVGQINYSASKSGIIAMTKTLAKELAPFGIMCNAVCPGYIKTDLNRNNAQKENNAMKSSLLPIEPCRSSLSSFLVYACSDLMKGVTGQVFNLDSRLV